MNIFQKCMIAALGALGLLLAGCAGDFDTAKIRAEATATAKFPQALGKAYLALAEAERAEADWQDANVFVERARLAFAGAPPQPEAPSERDLPPAIATQADAIRAELAAFHANGVTIFAAEAAAEAQAAYDCWLQEAEEGHQPADIDLCKARLDAALDLLRASGARAIFVLLPSDDGHQSAIVVSNDAASITLDTPGAAAVVGTAAAPQAAGVLTETELKALFADALAAKPPAPVRFVLYFETGTSILTPASAAELPHVQALAAARVAPRVDVVGHSDRVGAADVNARLSRVRAQAVADLLVAAGVPLEAVSVGSFGEADNAVPTADGVAEPRNRRVEVLVR